MSDLIDREQALSAFDTDDNELIIRGSENADTIEQYLKRVMYKIENLPSAQLGTNLAEVGTDCISRQAAIDALGEKPLAWEQGEYEEGLQTQWESDVEAIKVLPSAQPEPKRGRWTRDNACSECGYQPWFSGDIHNYNFCPNCGADMREFCRKENRWMI